MPKYYVNKNDSGNPNYNHEVHKEGCYWMPESYNCEFLGYFYDANGAVEKAKEKYSDADGCIHCCPEAHYE